MINCELFLIPLATIQNRLCVLAQRDPQFPDQRAFPYLPVASGENLQSTLRTLVWSLFDFTNSETTPWNAVEGWFDSERRKDRMIDAYDRSLLFEEKQSVAIVRALAIPDDLSPLAKGVWLDFESAFSDSSLLSPDNRLFLRECLKQIPLWVRNTTFSFELLAKIFSIQDLRNLVSQLSEQEIDPGNFHRRLKRLDILSPVAQQPQQRVHRWQFSWERGFVLSTDGLIP